MNFSKWNKNVISPSKQNAIIFIHSKLRCFLSFIQKNAYKKRKATCTKCQNVIFFPCGCLFRFVYICLHQTTSNQIELSLTVTYITAHIFDICFGSLHYVRFIKLHLNFWFFTWEFFKNGSQQFRQLEIMDFLTFERCVSIIVINCNLYCMVLYNNFR